VIALLERAEGAAIGELMATTGWLAHTTRAALTGLRKRGYTVELDKGSRYRMTAMLIVAKAA
jgi:DNA-binding IclR family transcriptional regulator